MNTEGTQMVHTLTMLNAIGLMGAGLALGSTCRGHAAIETDKFGYAPKRTGGRIRPEHCHRDDGVRGPETRQMRRADARRAAKRRRVIELRELAS